MAGENQQLRSVLESAVEGSDLYLEAVTTKQAGRRTVVTVVVDLPDGPGGVSSDQLSEVSRAVSAAMDEADPIRGAYVLEVTTPGIDRPLTTPRHYRRATGRKVSVTTADGERTGTLEAVTGEDLIIDGEAVPLASVSAGRMIIDFGKED